MIVQVLGLQQRVSFIMRCDHVCIMVILLSVVITVLWACLCSLSFPVIPDILSYNRKIWWELNLADSLESARARISVDLHLAVQHGIAIHVRNIGSCRREPPNLIPHQIFWLYIQYYICLNNNCGRICAKQWLCHQTLILQMYYDRTQSWTKSEQATCPGVLRHLRANVVYLPAYHTQHEIPCVLFSTYWHQSNSRCLLQKLVLA